MPEPARGGNSYWDGGVILQEGDILMLSTLFLTILKTLSILTAQRFSKPGL